MRKLYPLFFSIFFLQACKKWDKPEQVPAYIHIDHLDLSVTSTQGTASHAFIDAWVYVNDQPVGVFNLPATIPMLASGNQKISIYPGIKEDGLTEHRGKYSVCQEYITSAVNLVPGEIVDMSGANQPVITYYPSSKIDIWNENFEDAAVDFTADPNSETSIVYVDDSVNAFEGNGMGKIELISGFTFARVITAQSFNLPKVGKSVYVELNYKTNNSMAIGIQAIEGTQLHNNDYVVLNATNGVWKKVYVKLGETVSSYSNANLFKFIITVNKDNGVDVVENFVDNFKVVYAK